MVRKPPSPADVALIAAAAAHGVTVTATMLDRWRRAGLLPANILGPAVTGRGTTSATPPEALKLVLWLSEHFGPGRRPVVVALEAFAAGLPIPEATIRDAWLHVVTSLGLPETPPGATADEREDWIAAAADAVVARESHHPVLRRRRIRDLDARVAAAGFSWDAPEIAVFDKGQGTGEPFTRRDYIHVGTSAVLGGTGQFDDADLAGLARAMAPAGAAVPVASMLEFPDGSPALAEIRDSDGTGLLPGGDLREVLTDLITSAPLTGLRAAWDAVDGLRSWAESLCANLERELDLLATGTVQVGWPAIEEWYGGGVLGPNRVWLHLAVSDPASTTCARAHTAAVLLLVATTVNRLPALVPDGRLDLLPDLLPPFLWDLTGPLASGSRAPDRP